VLVSAAFDYFFVTGALGVVFALGVSVLGLMSSRFPGRALPALMLVSVALFLAGIIGAAVGAKYKSGERHGPPEGTPLAGHGSG
jgi:MFS family permease